MARKFYAPLLISGVENNSDSTVEIHLTSDKLSDVTGEVSWQLRTVAGKLIVEDSFAAAIKAQSNQLVKKIDLSKYVADYGIRNLMLFLELKVAGKSVSDNFVSFAKPKHMELLEPDFKTEITKITTAKYKIKITAAKTALWTWLELKNQSANYSDNFVHLYPGKTAEIILEPEYDLTTAELQSKLKVRSLIDTY
jgi:beta-mannosidase